MGSRPTGPFGIDPLHFASALFGGLLLFVLYLLLPRAVRKQYFGAYPKRYAWSTRRAGSTTGGGGGGASTRRSGSRSYAMVRCVLLLPVYVVCFLPKHVGVYISDNSVWFIFHPTTVWDRRLVYCRLFTGFFEYRTPRCATRRPSI